MGGGGDAAMDAFYDYATINDRMLGHGDPIKVREGQRVLFRVLNASATATHWLALAGHEFTVAGMDGNEVPQQAKVPAVRLAPAERIDLLVEMNRPGVWVLGETRAEIRKAGMGIVVEYANQQGEAEVDRSARDDVGLHAVRKTGTGRRRAGRAGSFSV